MLKAPFDRTYAMPYSILLGGNKMNVVNATEAQAKLYYLIDETANT